MVMLYQPATTVTSKYTTTHPLDTAKTDEGVKGHIKGQAHVHNEVSNECFRPPPTHTSKKKSVKKVSVLARKIFPSVFFDGVRLQTTITDTPISYTDTVPYDVRRFQDNGGRFWDIFHDVVD